MPAATAKPTAPVMPVAPAMFVEPPMVVPSRTTAQRGVPPPLPAAPPPAQLDDVLARFEAGPPDRLPETASPAPSLAVAEVMQPSPAWPAAEHRDSGGEHVDTGVAVVGADLALRPRNSRLRWVASVCGVLVLTGSAIWALSGGGTDAKAIAPARTAATQAPPISAKAPSATVEPQAANAVQQGASLEPAPAPSPPAVPEPETAVSEPEAAEPAGPAGPRTAPAAPHSPPSQKPCGKFLKRCK